MTKKIDSVLKDVLKNLKMENKRIIEIKNLSKDFLEKLEENAKKSGMETEVFVGGSLAKETMIKKDQYDIDIFIRFGKKHSLQNLSDLTQNILKKFKNLNVQRIHGSRDYFRIKISRDFLFEIIPVKKIKNPKEAENITDFSYSHVKYIKKRIKDSKIPDEIKLAKAFCYANNCYGAESYINGFSGYALELLIYHYGSFLKFIKEMVKVKENEKIIIDIEKHYKNKNNVLIDLNESKLQSPVILIDPTYKTRNVLAALSKETFKNFQKTCKDFLKNPGKDLFEREKINFKKIESDAKKRKYEFVLLQAKTDKQEGDIAGSKLKKFFKHLEEEIRRFFEIKNKGFEYDGKKTAEYFFVVKRKSEILIKGPLESQKEHVKKFRKKYKKTFVKNKHLYAKQKPKFELKQFLEEWKKKHSKKIGEMSVTCLKIK